MFENCKIAQTGSIPVHASNFFCPDSSSFSLLLSKLK